MEDNEYQGDGDFISRMASFNEITIDAPRG
jgi:hypothetical protein